MKRFSFVSSEENIASLENIGYPRELADVALKLHNGDISKAVNYCFENSKSFQVNISGDSRGNSPAVRQSSRNETRECPGDEDFQVAFENAIAAEAFLKAQAQPKSPQPMKISSMLSRFLGRTPPQDQKMKTSVDPAPLSTGSTASRHNQPTPMQSAPVLSSAYEENIPPVATNEEVEVLLRRQEKILSEMRSMEEEHLLELQVFDDFINRTNPNFHNFIPNLTSACRGGGYRV